MLYKKTFLKDHITLPADLFCTNVMTAKQPKTSAQMLKDHSGYRNCRMCVTCACGADKEETEVAVRVSMTCICSYHEAHTC